jgi:hypothetical protein
LLLVGVGGLGEHGDEPHHDYGAGGDPMTLTNLPPGSGLFVLLALFLTVATIWLLLRAIEALPNEIDPRTFLILIIVIIPFVMGIYFGLAAIICDEIVAGRSILPLELSLRKIVPAAVTYIGLSAWVWYRWRKLILKGE